MANSRLVPNIEHVVVFAADVMSQYEKVSRKGTFPEMVEIARKAYYDLIKLLLSKGSAGIRLAEASDQFVEHLLYLLEIDRKGTGKVGPTNLMTAPDLPNELRKIPETFNRLVEHFPYASGPNGLGS